LSIASLEQIIYAPVPHKGYSVRAKSKGADIDSFKDAFKDYLIPFDQSIVQRGFHEKVIVFGKKRLYLARVFQAQGLDELKRSGAVSNIVEVPLDLLLQKKLLLSNIDNLMAELAEKKEVPMGEIAPLDVPVGFEKDIEMGTVREAIPEDVFRKLMELSMIDRFKLFIIYRSQKSDVLSYGLARLISAASSKWIIISSENIRRDILFLYDGVLILGKILPPWARVKGWSIINLDKEQDPENTGSKSIESIIKDVYHEKGTDENTV
jgi:hypothetical protein